jgi:DNA-binding response OmpR family regulator
LRNKSISITIFSLKELIPVNTVEEVNITSKKILIIDDEVSVKEIVGLCLKDIGGWDVVIADSPLDGLHRAELVHPDAIILDLSIRAMNAFRLMQQLRSNPKTNTIPIVLLSAKVRWIDPHILKEYQIAGIILKPFDPINLHFQIAAILGWNEW